MANDPEKACPALDAGCAAVFRKVMRKPSKEVRDYFPNG
jgi:hypothetical protein